MSGDDKPATAASPSSSTLGVPVQASSFGPCYARSGFSFKHETTSLARIIHAYRGTSCSGTNISYGQVTKTGSDLYLEARDVACDSTGISLYTHGPSRTDTSCSYPGSRDRYPRSAFSSPLNFWINVGGVNSNAMNLP